MKITVFAGEYGDNPALRKEYGLGLYIQTEKHNCLFDFGNKTAEHNLSALDISPESSDVAVLSRGCVFGGGGLLGMKSRLLSAGTKLYARESAFESHYFKKSRWNYKNVSLPKKLTSDGVTFAKSFLKIDDELSLVSNFKSDKKEISEARWFVDGEKFFVPDTFLHEQALIVCEKGKTVLFVGGATAGLRAMLDRAEKTFSRPVSAVVGGLSLTDKRGKPLVAEARIRELSLSLAKNTSAEYYFAAGIGDGAFDAFQESLGSRLHRLSVGETKVL